MAVQGCTYEDHQAKGTGWRNGVPPLLFVPTSMLRAEFWWTDEKLVSTHESF
jgi:hypothetical protein